MALTPKQAKFVEVFAGNATEAARLAGYAGSDNVLAQVGRANLRNPQIASVLEGRQAAELAPHIANRQARQAFWTEVMSDVGAEMRDRLKASELLGKSEADFTDKVKHEGTVSIAVVDPYAVKPELTGG